MFPGIKFEALFQTDSDGSRSGSSLSLRTQNAGGPGVGGAPHNGGSASAATPGAHPSASRPSAADRGGDASHRGVQRSISASASSKSRKTSTNVEPTPAAVGEFCLEFSGLGPE